MSGMMGMHDMSATDMAALQALQSATGTEFNNLFVSQMLAMHDAKLTELRAASTTVKDPQLKALVNSAIPKIKLHRDMLAKMNNGGINQ
jgi:predicted outer membrane protein